MFRLCCSLALLMAGLPAAYAQAEDEAVDLGTLQVTAGRRAESTVDVPQPVTVLTRDDIERAPVQSWTEAMRGQPGAFVQSSGPGQGIVIVRGLKGSEVLHLVDGFRLNNAFFRNAPSQYIALVDPMLIDRIELVRGPNSVLYGSDAMGGVIQLLTPEQRFDGDRLETSGRARWQMNTQDLSNVTRTDFAVGRNGLSAQFGGSWKDHGERTTPDDGRLRDTDYTARALDAKLLVAAGDGGEWMLSWQDFRIPKLARYHQIVPGFGTQADSEFNFFLPNERRFLHGRYRHFQPIGPLQGLELQLGRQVIVDDRLGRDTGSTEDTREFNRSTLQGLTLQASTLLADGAELLYGLEYYHDEVNSSRTVTDNGQTSTARARFPDGSSERSFGAWLQHAWHGGSGWLLETGLRFSAVETDLPVADRGIGVNVRENDLTGSLGLLLPIRAGFHWTANIGRGFRAPNVFDLGTLGPRPGNRFNVPNPDLGAETVWNYDTGIKYLGTRCSGEFGVFLQDYDDRIASVATGNPRSDGRTEVQSRNLARARYTGIETAGRCRVLPALGVSLALNYTRGEETLDGSTAPADRVPPLNGRLAVDWQAGANWSLRSDLLFADDQSRLAAGDVSDSRINPNGTGGWLRWDLGGRWQALPGFHVDLALLNLLDAQYREHGSGIDAPGFGASLALDYRW